MSNAHGPRWWFGGTGVICPFLQAFRPMVPLFLWIIIMVIEIYAGLWCCCAGFMKHCTDLIEVSSSGALMSEQVSACSDLFWQVSTWCFARCHLQTQRCPQLGDRAILAAPWQLCSPSGSTEHNREGSGAMEQNKLIICIRSGWKHLIKRHFTLQKTLRSFCLLTHF